MNQLYDTALVKKQSFHQMLKRTETNQGEAEQVFFW